MVKDRNDPELWDEYWKTVSRKIYSKKYLEVTEKSLVWKTIKKNVLKEFGTFKGLKVIEIGAGSGSVSLLFGLNGAEVVALDYSKKGLEMAKENFDHYNIKSKLVLGDALKLDKKLKNKFHVSMSFGLAEHFTGDKRNKIIKSHFDVLKKGGISFISVPNKYCLPYRVWKYLSEKKGVWQFGTEYPFSRGELKRITKHFTKKSSIFGGGMLKSLRLLSPFKKKYDKNENPRSEFITPFDKYLGNYLFLVGIKK